MKRHVLRRMCFSCRLRREPGYDSSKKIRGYHARAWSVFTKRKDEFEEPIFVTLIWEDDFMFEEDKSDV